MKSLVGYAKLSIVAASLFLIVPSVASAQKMGRDMPTFESYDLNKDGTLTESEMNEARAIRQDKRKADGKLLRNSKSPYPFSDIDTNKDGVVDKKEFEEHQLKRRIQ
ncbi:MAG: EF-hand domain-containing protein [Sulfurimonas sp.]|jgi:Ca2+-binding EF-hand superfamily protein